MGTWKPKLGEIYWRMTLGGLPELSKYTGSGISQEDYELGNCHPSLKACEEVGKIYKFLRFAPDIESMCAGAEEGDYRVNTAATTFELNDLSAIRVAIERIANLLEKNCVAVERIATVQEKNRSDNEGTPYDGIFGY